LHSDLYNKDVKDASQTLPGFGGVLDVLDSLLFAGPIAYGYWLIFGP
jgi:phosphatidate cytidylyltransferase